MVNAGAARVGETWRRRLRAARIEAAVTNAGTALLAGGTGIAAVVCYVAEVRGWLHPGTWAVVLAGGGVVTPCKAYFDFRDRSTDGELWRQILIREFGDDMRRDNEAAKLARLAIEFRVRLSEAEAKAAPALVRQVAVPLPRVDDWLDLIVGLAQKVASLRGEARFQAGIAGRARQRVADIEAQARVARDPAQASRLGETARALSAQVRAFDGFNQYVDDGYLRLEHAVGAFSAACSQLVLELARDDGAAGQGGPAIRIGDEMAAIATSLAAIGQLAVPQLPEVAGDPAAPGPPPVAGGN